MTLKDIRIYDDPILRKVAKPIKRIVARHRTLARDMAETMYEERGIGLAAPQIGVLERLIVVDVDWARSKDDEKPEQKPIAMINPEAILESVDDDVYCEGCLSLPDIEGDVWRSISMKVRYRDLEGKTVERDAEGLFARCILHEIDHLNGLLFIDRMAEIERKGLAGALRRLAKAAGTGGPGRPGGSSA